MHNKYWDDDICPKGVPFAIEQESVRDISSLLFTFYALHVDGELDDDIGYNVCSVCLHEISLCFLVKVSIHVC